MKLVRLVIDKIYEVKAFNKFKPLIDAVDAAVYLVELEPCAEHLHPQVVFLVDHDAEFLASVDGHGPSPAAFGVLAADEVPLDKLRE